MSGDYVAGWSRKLNLDKGRRNMQAQEAAAAQRCAHLLYENYGVSKVYLFGSLNTPEAFHEKSDIDLVVKGLPSHLYFKALASFGGYCPQRWSWI